MKKATFVFLMLLTTLLINCSDRGNLDSCATFDDLDLEMLNLIDRIEANHANNKKFLHKFNLEQVYWIQYRDSHLRALYPEDWDRHYRGNYGKELFNPCKCKEMIRFTQARINELKLWEKGGPGGQEECPSLWNTQ